MATATRPERRRATAPVIAYERPWLYAKQKAALFHPARYVLVEASTKSGKTTGCFVWLFEKAAIEGAPGRNFWWVAPTFSVAKIVYRRMKRAIPRALYSSNETELTLTLANGAVIWFKGADNPDTLYGDDVYAVVIDEASRCKEESWHAVRSTLTATRGPARIIGNVKGRKNWAYTLARRAESGALPDAAYFKLTAHDAVEAGVLDAAEVEDAKRTLPENVYRELYLAEPSDDGGNPFGLEAIRSVVAPPSGLSVVLWGADLAKSVDHTVAWGLDASGRCARIERFQLPWELTLAKFAALFGTTRALIDSTGVGDPVLEALQKRCPHVEGYKFTSASKQQLMEGLAVDIQQGVTSIPPGVPQSEHESFEYEYTRTGVRYTAPDGLFDDTVCAHALARMAFRRPAPAWPRARGLTHEVIA